MRSSLRRRRRHAVAGLIYRLLLLVPLTASMVGQGQTSAVPRLVRFSGVVKDAQGNPRSGAVGVTFGLYKDEQGGSPLWLETQNVQADAQGHYTVSLGATLANGLPQDLFVSGEARWLGVRPEGQSEQPRTLLMSVPYALKAGDAETIGGRPASAFMLAPADAAGSSQNSVPPDGTITGGGTANFVPLFTGTTTIGNSKVFQTAGGDIGIGTTKPAAALDVKGKADVRDTLTLIPKTTNPTLSVKGTVFAVSSTGVVTFAGGQTFPGTGTITGVAAGTDLTGGGNSGNVTLNVDTTKVVTGITAGTDLTGGGTGGVQTLNLDTTKVPQLGTSNLFVGTQAIHGGDLTLDAGNLNLPNTGAITLGGTRILSTSSVAPRGNTSLGLGTFNPNGSGEGNTATGTYALASNSTGSDNTATGMYALFLATGDGNTAVGTDALYHTLTSGNAAVGVNALFSNTGGTLNTAIGAAALEFNNTGSYNTGLGSNTTGPQSYDVSNATAIGAFAEVDESNAMVLGSINGVNFATADTNVGIGTTQPQTLLHI